MPASVVCVAYNYSKEFTTLSAQQSSSSDSNSLYARMTAVKLLADKLAKESCQWAGIQYDDLTTECVNKPAVPAGLLWHLYEVSSLDTCKLPLENQWVASIVNSPETDPAVVASINSVTI